MEGRNVWNAFRSIMIGNLWFNCEVITPERVPRVRLKRINRRRYKAFEQKKRWGVYMGSLNARSACSLRPSMLCVAHTKEQSSNILSALIFLGLATLSRRLMSCTLSMMHCKNGKNWLAMAISFPLHAACGRWSQQLLCWGRTRGRSSARFRPWSARYHFQRALKFPRKVASHEKMPSKFKTKFHKHFPWHWNAEDVAPGQILGSSQGRLVDFPLVVAFATHFKLNIIESAHCTIIVPHPGFGVWEQPVALWIWTISRFACQKANSFCLICLRNMTLFRQAWNNGQWATPTSGRLPGFDEESLGSTAAVKSEAPGAELSRLWIFPPVDCVIALLHHLWAVGRHLGSLQSGLRHGRLFHANHMSLAFGSLEVCDGDDEACLLGTPVSALQIARAAVLQLRPQWWFAPKLLYFERSPHSCLSVPNSDILCARIWRGRGGEVNSQSYPLLGSSGDHFDLEIRHSIWSIR